MATVRSDLEIKADARSIRDLGREMKKTFRGGGASARRMRTVTRALESQIKHLQRHLAKTNKELEGLRRGTDEFKSMTKEAKQTERQIRRLTRALQNHNKERERGGGGRGRGRRGLGPVGAAAIGGVAGFALGRVGSGFTQAMSQAATAAAVPTSQPLAAHAAFAQMQGAALGNIPILGAIVNMNQAHYAAGMNIGQQRLDSYKNWRQGNLRLQDHFTGNFNRFLNKRSGYQSVFDPSMMTQFAQEGAGAAGPMRFNADGQTFKDIMDLALRRGSPAALGRSLSTFAPGMGQLDTVYYRQRRRGQPYQRRPFSQDPQEASRNLTLALHGMAATESQRAFGQTGRLGKTSVENLLNQLVSLGKEQASRGVKWHGTAILGMVEALRVSADKSFKNNATAKRLDIGANIFAGDQSMALMKGINASMARPGSALNTIGFMAALRQGKGVLGAMAATRKGIGGAMGQLNIENIRSQTQRMFGTGGDDYDIMDFILEGELGGLQKAAAFRRLGEIGDDGGFRKRFGTATNIFGSTTKSGAVNIGGSMSRALANAGFDRRQVSKIERIMNREAGRNIREGYDISRRRGEDGKRGTFVDDIVKKQRDRQKRLMENAMSDVDSIDKNIKGIRTVMGSMTIGVGEIIGVLATIADFVGAPDSAVENIRETAESMKKMGNDALPD